MAESVRFGALVMQKDPILQAQLAADDFDHVTAHPDGLAFLAYMNAAGALMVSGAASSLQDGFRLAEKSIDTGAAFRRLQLLREMSQ